MKQYNLIKESFVIGSSFGALTGGLAGHALADFLSLFVNQKQALNEIETHPEKYSRQYYYMIKNMTPNEYRIYRRNEMRRLYIPAGAFGGYALGGGVGLFTK